MTWKKYSYIECKGRKGNKGCVFERDHPACKGIIEEEGLTQDEAGCGKMEVQK